MPSQDEARGMRLGDLVRAGMPLEQAKAQALKEYPLT
jgi:hypothetical protein